MKANPKLLAAFQVEHIEHLEGIRSMLAGLGNGGGPVAGTDLDDAFRRAHSLKGAARITGFTPVEALAHRLEDLFSRVRDGSISLEEEALRVIHLTLDTIEDWVACQGSENPAPDPQRALDELDALLVSNPQAPILRPASTSLAIKLRAGFEEECPKYVSGMRAYLAKARAPDSGAAPADLDEALRCVHSLKGAARIVEVGPVDVIADRLENIFTRIQQGRLPLDAATLDCIEMTLEAIEESVSLPTDHDAPKTAIALDALDRILRNPPQPQKASIELAGTEISPAPEAHRGGDMLRLSAESLDKLLQSAGQLSTESLQQDQVTREIGRLGRLIGEIEKEWNGVKRTSGAALRRMAATPEFAGVTQHLGFIEARLHTLSRQVRAAEQLQQRGAWSLRLLGGQLQQEVRSARLAPAENVFQGFRKMMRDLARDEKKEIEFRVSGFETQVDCMVLQALKDPIMHILRNALCHGIEPSPERKLKGKSPIGMVSLRIEALGNKLTLTVEDNGRGIDLAHISQTAIRRALLTEEEAAVKTPAELIRLLFQPGFSTSRVVTELSGRGMGLSSVFEAAARLQGAVEIKPREGSGMALILTVPLSVSTHRLLLVSCMGLSYAIPIYGIDTLQRIKLREIETVQGRPMVVIAGQPVPFTSLARLLGLGDSDDTLGDETCSLVILRSGSKRLALAVDQFLSERDALIKDLGRPASGIGRFAGGILLEDGSISLVLNPSELVENFQSAGAAPTFKKIKIVEKKKVPCILVVDDSFTTRTLETGILETHGYKVRAAVDGVQALVLLRSEKFDLVITDIEMPRLDGFGLLEEIKKDPSLSRIPVIIVSSLERREDQERGLNLGADAYIIKRKFDHQDLLQTIQQIL